MNNLNFKNWLVQAEQAAMPQQGPAANQEDIVTQAAKDAAAEQLNNPAAANKPGQDSGEAMTKAVKEKVAMKLKSDPNAGIADIAKAGEIEEKLGNKDNPMAMMKKRMKQKMKRKMRK